jgi:kynureninase
LPELPGAEIATARELDHKDPLRSFRDEFFMPRGETYLCGHSLGLQPKRTTDYIDEELIKWQELGVKAHTEGDLPWLPYHRSLAAPMAALIGADESEVVMMNSLTINLHLLMVSFYRPTTDRHKILLEKKAFPSDRYAVESQIRFHGYDPSSSLIEMAPRPGEDNLRLEDIVATIDRERDSLALVLFPGVQYFTGQAFEIAEITRAAHGAKAVAGFDLAHAAGNLELAMHDAGADFAVWCSYKYLNSGPGSVGGAFVHARHATRTDLPRLAGWWGHDEATRFAMGPEFRAMSGADGWQVSNPPILSLAAVRAALDVFTEAGGLAPLRRKSERLTAYLESLLSGLASEVEIITPSEPHRRGCQLSIRLKRDREEARRIFEDLERKGITCDWREPNVIRAAPVPLYNRFEDVHRFAGTLASLLRAKN